jgi:subtilase family serine protease
MTMVVVEDSDLYTNGDWYTFRKTLGLTRAFPYGNLVVSHPTVGTLTGDGSATCTDPGDNSADGEAAIDVEWSSAVAPNATIVMATCKDVGTAASGFGGFLALQNLETEVGHPNVVSISYGESEEITGATSNAYINTLYQTAVLEGISVFVSSGDDGASSSDRDATKGATHGINVTGWGSSQYVTSVGGTDFEDGYLNDYGQYWNTTNTSKFGSAKSYIPEIPWNDTCASALFLAYIQANDPGLGTFTNVYGSGGLCNNSVLVSDDYEETGGGSGGPSNCATGAATISETYSGTCAGWPKPSYQTGIVGNPSDGVRDLPDVALMASNGFWGHYYITCYSHTAYEGVACGPTVSAWAGYGGTSVSTPIMAAIQLLVNQKTGQSWGNANYTYYAIAKSQYGASGNPACNSSAAGGPSASCDFNDITAGDMADACAPQFSSVRSGRTTTYTYVGTFNCFGSSYTEVNNTTAPVLTYGVLSTNNTGPSPTPAYGTNTGWDFATGIGSVNATTLVNDPAWLQP